MFTKRTIRLGTAIAVVTALLVIGVSVVGAVSDLGLFELDGNATDGAAAGDDWQSLFDNPDVLPDASIAKVFVADGDSVQRHPGLPIDTTWFDMGGSKDVNDIPQWMHDDGDVSPDKDEILNAFAAAYVYNGAPGPNADPGDLIVYFGADRFAVNGDSQIGFWFLQDDVYPKPDNTFNGQHQVGDILVLSDFTQGGATPIIRVYEWVASGGDVDDNLLLLAEGAGCAGSPEVCAEVNASDEQAYWPYQTKSNKYDPMVYPPGAFYEGGINLTQLLGGDVGCFSTFLAETRSSASVDAQLKDFALGQFALCDLEVDKTGDTLSKVSDPVDYTITITNTGAITLYQEDVVDTLLGDLLAGANPYVTGSTCGASLAAGASCTITATRVVQAGDADPLPNTVTVTYDSSAGLVGDEVTREDDHEVNLFQPSITFDKSGGTLSKVGDDVNYTITLNNTSSADTPDLECTITDALLGINKNVTLASGASDVTNAAYTVQEGDPDPLLNTAEVDCSPLGFSNLLEASDGHSVDLFQPSINLTKEGDELSKIGDPVDYTITLHNASSPDTPDLECTITDTLLGVNKNVTLASGASDVINVTGFVIPAGASDPFVNTAEADCSPVGFTNSLQDAASHSVNLFQPAIDLTKKGDELSKIGDPVDYTITLYNNSSADTPDLECTVTDETVGWSASFSLASGANQVISVGGFIPADASDPFENTAYANCSPDGFDNVLNDEASHEVNLFQPAIAVAKTGPQYSKLGDDVDYVVTLSNNSSADTPPLNCIANDSLLGAVFNGVLPLGDTVLNLSRPVQAGDPDPLVNTVTLDCSPDGFTNALSDSASHTVDLIHPSFTVEKFCDAEPISFEGPAFFTVTIANTGDVPLDITADDGIGSFQLDAGVSQDFSVSVPGPFTPGGTADNTVTASWTLPELYGLSNTDTKSASDSCDVLQIEYETAYGMGDPAVCFTDLGAGNWGWVNGPIEPGTYVWDVWAGAADCDITKGTLVGTVTVVYDPTTYEVSVTWNIDPQYILGDTHVYAGYDAIPPGGFSPGQWENYGPFDGSPIYIIVHAVVGIPQ